VTTGYGSVALYALAGIEDRTVTPPLFTAYSMGFMTGLTLQPGQTLEDVFIPMNMPLDHSLSLTVVGPTPTAAGPDRVTAQVGVRMGGFGYATLPVGPKVATLPVATPLSFVGLPAIGSGGSGLNYVLSARAATGDSGSVPSSFAGLFSTTAMDTSVTLSGFLEIPVLTTPASGATWNGRDLAITTAPGGPEPELTLFEIQSGNGLSTWTVVAPKGVTSVALPDLASLGSVGLSTGPVSIQVTRARISGFDYGSLRYRDLGESGWDAAATNVFPSHL
jgi:hypothetical protein